MSGNQDDFFWSQEAYVLGGMWGTDNSHLTGNLIKYIQGLKDLRVI